jgi:SAM-dependent methyltransferase
MVDGTNAGQAEFWNTDAGQRWVDTQGFMDTLLAPVLGRLLGSAAIQAGDTVLDIGCGTGASVMELSVIVGPEGAVQGCDISQVMLSHAGKRIAALGNTNADLILADAQTHDFPSSRFERVVSRFGVMFFDDPVAAFTNISKGLRSGGQITLMAWAPVARNPWFKIALDACVARLGPLDVAPDPNAPGPMGFQDAKRVESILDRAGFVEVSSNRIDVDLDAGPSLDGATSIAMTLGPAVRFLEEKTATNEDAKAITAQVKTELSKFLTQDGMRIPSDLILYQARKP